MVKWEIRGFLFNSFQAGVAQIFGEQMLPRKNEKARTWWIGGEEVSPCHVTVSQTPLGCL